MPDSQSVSQCTSPTRSSEGFCLRRHNREVSSERRTWGQRHSWQPVLQLHTDKAENKRERGTRGQFKEEEVASGAQVLQNVLQCRETDTQCVSACVQLTDV
jgi:hypothetical protein